MGKLKSVIQDDEINRKRDEYNHLLEDLYIVIDAYLNWQSSLNDLEKRLTKKIVTTQKNPLRDSKEWYLKFHELRSKDYFQEYLKNYEDAEQTILEHSRKILDKDPKGCIYLVAGLSYYLEEIGNPESRNLWKTSDVWKEFGVPAWGNDKRLGGLFFTAYSFMTELGYEFSSEYAYNPLCYN